MLLELNRSAVSSPGAGSAGLESLGVMLLSASQLAVWLSFVFLSVGSILNNWLFFKSKAIPRLLGVYGLISTALYTLGSILALAIDLPESATMGLTLPMVLFELGLGFYLAIFGMQKTSAG